MHRDHEILINLGVFFVWIKHVRCSDNDVNVHMKANLDNVAGSPIEIEQHQDQSIFNQVYKIKRLRICPTYLPISILFALISKYIHGKFNHAIFLRESTFLLYKVSMIYKFIKRKWLWNDMNKEKKK